MPFPDDLLNPIEGPNRSGANLRYDPIYDKIKEARREEDQPPPGMTERDRKVAENPLVIKLVTDLLAKRTKDLQLAAWLTEALLKQKGFGGLKDGLALCYGFVDKFWDTVFPELEDGDAQARGAPLGFVGTKLPTACWIISSLAKSDTRIRQRPMRPRRSEPRWSRRASLLRRLSIRFLKRLRKSFTRRPSRILTFACKRSLS
jgi:type VI secretion system ImpA family protein